MGGFGSGAPRRTIYIDEASPLGATALMKAVGTPTAAGCGGFFRRSDGTPVGTWGLVATASHLADLMLTTPGDDGAGAMQSFSQRVEMEAQPQPFGGLRWWFVCPRTSRRCATIYRPPGARTFASRHAWPIAYRSKSQNGAERARSQSRRIRRQLGDEGLVGDPVRRPPRMHWTTFVRITDRLNAIEEHAFDDFLPVIGRVLAKTR